MERRKQCPVCSSDSSQKILEIPSVPIHCNHLLSDRQRAVSAPTGEICLVYCPHCSHLFNTAMDPNAVTYNQEYENSLYHSPRFREHAESSARRLIEKYAISGKTVVEVGCGNGEFLSLLSDMGGNKGIGFDPAYRGSRKDLTIIPDLYSEKYRHEKPDLLCCIHLLEHVADPLFFLRSLPIQKNTTLYFEVPNALYTLDDLGIWDLIYEHFSYYTIRSLSYLFNLAGFRISEVYPAFHNQFIALIAQQGVGAEPADIELDVQDFAARFQSKLDGWQKRLQEHRGRRAVVWGAGSKGVSFLNMLENDVEYVVDINPAKIGKFVAGGGQQIVPPEFLRAYRPEEVILMNPNYMGEVTKCLADLDLSPTVTLA